jgi:hypothetical protein
VKAQLASGPGAGAIVATSRADDTHAAARAELAIVRRLETELDAEATLASRDSPRVELRAQLRPHGDSKLVLANKAIGVFVDGAHLATLTTDAQGSVRRTLELPITAGDTDRELSLVARFDPDAPWLGASHSRAVRLTLHGHAPPSPLWLLLPVALSIVLARVLARRARPRLLPDAQARSSVPGIQAGATRRRGPAALRDIDGRVVDATTGQPLTAAGVELIDAQGEVRIASLAADGSFRFSALPSGKLELRAAADGYAPVHASIAVPHAGEGSGLRVGLVSLRKLALDKQRPIAARVLASERQALSATPREVLDHARRKHGAAGQVPEALDSLTERVERAAYGQAQPNAQDLTAIDDAARAAGTALDEHAAHGGGPGTTAREPSSRWER